jgi:NAD(P)H-dependent flavin oxidoreductase YrpB (nitropropane dioxygenase family)
LPADSDRPLYKILSTKTIWWASILILLVAAAVTTWLLLAFGYQLEAIKTASTIVLGTGGAAALLLAARRQRSTELALNQKDRDLAHQERDAIERRITDLYTKAADQLGSDKAPVRLAGLYALERVAQNNPDLRQTIVNVWCAYLRMPYQLPGADTDHPTRVDRLQEREVRLTA